jgi:hypothetical protein
LSDSGKKCDLVPTVVTEADIRRFSESSRLWFV